MTTVPAGLIGMPHFSNNGGEGSAWAIFHGKRREFTARWQVEDIPPFRGTPRSEIHMALGPLACRVTAPLSAVRQCGPGQCDFCLSSAGTEKCYRASITVIEIESLTERSFGQK
jgi:hypothetical protein